MQGNRGARRHASFRWSVRAMGIAAQPFVIGRWPAADSGLDLGPISTPARSGTTCQQRAESSWRQVKTHFNAEELKRRAIEAVIWGMLAFNAELMYQAMAQAKGGLQPGRLPVTAGELEEPDQSKASSSTLTSRWISGSGRRRRRGMNRTGYRPCPAKAGSCCSICTARCNRGSTKPGGPVISCGRNKRRLTTK